jgi:hypothetical protein
MFYDIYLYTLCYYICCLLGACMRCTRLCPLKPGVTHGRIGMGSRKEPVARSYRVRHAGLTPVDRCVFCLIVSLSGSCLVLKNAVHHTKHVVAASAAKHASESQLHDFDWND